MSGVNSLPSERVAILGTIDPDAYGTGTVTSDWCNLEIYGSGMAIILAGAITTSAGLDAKLEQGTNSTGGSAKDIDTSDITQFTSGDSDKQAIINIPREALDTTGGFGYVRLSVTTSTDAVDYCGVILGIDPRHGPASDNDLSTVDEIVTPTS
jgi:hypothetical protein|tara:strand:- start:22304 stop:22762 length:459 start_codon:yes stop_codon:yes gene_type:complete